MAEYAIYQDIATRTGGEIYIGVVGPVRTGKSTFIKRFMETLVLPGIADAHARERARDELPQSAGGKTVMTTEPKFIPDEAVQVSLSDGVNAKVRMVDCVGYLVPDVLGTQEDGKERMVHTPWQAEPMPFVQAAEMGTRKVICDHATIGMLVTTDGSIGELPRSAYVEAEERIVRELKELGKPFAVILNTADPTAPAAITQAYALEQSYGVPVALVNCLDLDSEDIRQILSMVLHEFPIRELSVRLPEWTAALDENHRIRLSVESGIDECAAKVRKTGDVAAAFSALEDNEYVRRVDVEQVSLGDGTARLNVSLADGLYYQVISELTGFEIGGEQQLLALLRSLSEMKNKYDRVADALERAERDGYGIVMPEIDDLHLEDPEIVKQQGGYGVHLRASAQSIHMIRANIETEINPVVGTQQQSEDLLRYMLQEFEGDPGAIWQSNLFGKTLYDLVNEGLHAKLEHMAPDARARLSETLERIINEGSNGLICILL